MKHDPYREGKLKVQGRQEQAARGRERLGYGGGKEVFSIYSKERDKKRPPYQQRSLMLQYDKKMSDFLYIPR